VGHPQHHGALSGRRATPAAGGRAELDRTLAPARDGRVVDGDTLPVSHATAIDARARSANAL
jgi:hypothetical protein